MRVSKVIMCALFCLFAFKGQALAEGMAAGQVQRLVVWLKGGEKVYFDLEESPQTSFSGSQVVVTTNTVTASYPREQVLKFTYSMGTTGIESLMDNEVRISQKGDAMTFENLKNGSNIYVYSVDGVQKGEYRISSSQAVTISLASYPSGLYLVKVNNTTYKFLKR